MIQKNSYGHRSEGKWQLYVVVENLSEDKSYRNRKRRGDKEKNKTKGKEGEDQGRKNSETPKDNRLDAPKNILSYAQELCFLLCAICCPLESSLVLKMQLGLD